MPIMTRMRDSMPVILFGLLIAFLITIVFEWGMDYLGMRGGGQSDVIGKVNGHKITYKEFSELVKTLSDNAKTQTGQEPDESMQPQLREQAWESIINQRLVDEEVQRLGITVSDQELTDWVYGENPPEDLKRNFIDSTGQFNRDLYEQVLRNPNQYITDPRGSDPNYGVKRLQEFEKQLRLRRIQEKLQSVVGASVRVTDGEARQRFIDQYEHYEASYALFDPAVLVKDGDVSVTDADLHAYYDENVDQFKYEGSRKLKYAVFLENPSASDSSDRRKEIEDVAAKARSGADFLQLVSTYSDKADSGAFFHRGELSPRLDSAVFAAAPGAIIGPIDAEDGLHVAKILAERKSDKEYVHAAHILIPVTAPDSAQAIAQAKSIAAMAREGKNFADLAREYSRDGSNASNGGDLGWFGKGRMVPAFEKACLGATPGQIVGPVRTQFGLHIIKVYGRDSREVKVANITTKITVGSQTKNDIADRAKDFSYNARQSEISQEAQQTGIELRETQVQEKGGVVPGIGVNEAIVRWAFGAKVGAVSEPFTITNGSAVLSVAEVKEAGVKKFDEVKESVQGPVLRKKKLEKAKQLAADARALLAPGEGLEMLTQKNPSIHVQTTGPFTASGVIAGIGRDPGFVGAASGLTIGQISPPVEGLRGAYLIQLTVKSGFDSTAFAGQKELLRSRMLQEKKGRFVSDWLQRLKEKADIEDKRDIFFR